MQPTLPAVIRAALCACVLMPVGFAGAQTATPAQVAKRDKQETSELQAQGLLGDDASASSAPTPRNADGHPDFSGIWKGSKATKPVGNIGKDLPGFKLPLTSAGEQALHDNLTKVVDPESRCLIGGIPRHDASALPFAIVQNNNRVTWLYVYTYYRSVPFDIRRHEDDPDPQFWGDEIGWWEGDTFIVDAVGFKSKDMWIDENGNPASGRMHATERWSRPDAGHLHVEVRIDDPLYYTHPFTYSRTWIAGKPNEKLFQSLCTENNADLPHLGPGPGGVRADGTRGYDVAPLPDNPPGPEAYDK
jgi:hypothetical protein